MVAVGFEAGVHFFGLIFVIMMGNSHHPKILKYEREGPVSYGSNKTK